MSRRFGFEAELSGGASDVLAILARKKLAPTSELHDYHCDCEDCDYESEWVFRGQEDCTADGEIITKILTWGTREADIGIKELASAMQAAGAGISQAVGLHVHVDAEDLDDADIIRTYRLFILYQEIIGRLARGAASCVREYNSRVTLNRDLYGSDFGFDESVFWRHDPAGISTRRLRGKRHSWLTGPTDHGTFEFRVWNATLSEWRIRLAVGTSVALVNAAKAGVTVTDSTKATFAETVGPFLPPDIFAYAIRQGIYQERRAA